MNLYIKSVIISVLVFICLYSKGQKLDLDYYVDLAIKNNQNLAFLNYKINAQKENKTIITAFKEPMLTTGYFLSPIQTRVGEQVAKVGVNQSFPWFGTMKSKGKVEDIETRILELELVDQKALLRYKIAKQYYLLYKQDKLQLLEKEHIDLLQSLKKVATAMYQNRKASMADILRIQVVIDDVQTKTKLLKDEYYTLESTFEYLLGKPEDLKIELLDTLAINNNIIHKDDLDTLVINNNTVKIDSISNHPLIKIEAEKVQKYEQELEIITKKSKPNFNLGLEYIFINNYENLHLSDNGKNAIMASLKMSLPVKTKKYRAMKSKSKFKAMGYKQREIKNRYILENQIDINIFRIKKNIEEYRLKIKQIKTLKQALTILTTEYSVDGKDIQDVLDTYEQLIKYKKEMLKLAVNYKIEIEKQNYILTN